MACGLLAASRLAGAGIAPHEGPSFLDLQLSPDGHRLAALVEQGEHRRLVVVHRSDGVQQRVSDAFPGRIEGFFWANRERLVFTSAEDTGLYGVDRDGRGLTTLREPDEAPTAPRLVDPLVHDAEHVLVALPLGPGQEAVFRLDVRTGRRERLALPFRYAHDWLVDRSGSVRVIVTGAAPAARVFYRADTATAWRELGAAGFAPPEFTPLGLTEDDRLVIAGPTDAGPYAVQVLDPADGALQPLASGLPADDLPVLKRTPTRRTLIALEYTSTVPSQQIIAPFWRALLATVNQALPDSRNLVYQMSDDETAILVLACTDRAECAFHLLDRHTNRLEFLGHRAAGHTHARPANDAAQIRAGQTIGPRS